VRKFPSVRGWKKRPGGGVLTSVKRLAALLLWAGLASADTAVPGAVRPATIEAAGPELGDTGRYRLIADDGPHGEALFLDAEQVQRAFREPSSEIRVRVRGEPIAIRLRPAASLWNDSASWLSLQIPFAVTAGGAVRIEGRVRGAPDGASVRLDGDLFRGEVRRGRFSVAVPIERFVHAMNRGRSGSLVLSFRNRVRAEAFYLHPSVSAGESRTRR
jgi:hypothetical protein